MEKLSSGNRINKSADDAAGLAISEQMQANIKSLGQAKRNANDGVSLIQTAEGSMNEISNILIRMRELSTQAASDTISNTERSYTNREYSKLSEEVDRIAKTTEFNGVKLLDGGEESGLNEMMIHVGAGDGAEENTDTIRFEMENVKISAETLGLGNEEEIGPIEPDGDFSRETAAEKLGVIDDAISQVANKRAFLGSQQSRLQKTINNLGVAIENQSVSKSRIRDADFASETAELTQVGIRQQAGAAVLGQANSTPEIALRLL
jgi:flagellin